MNGQILQNLARMAGDSGQSGSAVNGGYTLARQPPSAPVGMRAKFSRRRLDSTLENLGQPQNKKMPNLVSPIRPNARSNANQRPQGSGFTNLSYNRY